MVQFMFCCKFGRLQKVSPPSPFKIVTGALEGEGPVLKRVYGDEEISISVMRLAHIVGGGDEDDDGINPLFVHVDVSKPGQKDSLHFLCGLYPDALGIHSVYMRPKHENQGFLVVPSIMALFSSKFDYSSYFDLFFIFYDLIPLLIVLIFIVMHNVDEYVM